MFFLPWHEVCQKLNQRMDKPFSHWMHSHFLAVIFHKFASFLFFRNLCVFQLDLISGSDSCSYPFFPNISEQEQEYDWFEIRNIQTWNRMIELSWKVVLRHANTHTHTAHKLCSQIIIKMPKWRETVYI